MIWRIRDFKLLLVSLIIDLHKPKFGEAVLESNTIKPDAPNLNPD